MYPIIKRLFDFVVSSLFLILLLPVFLVIGILVRSFLGSPILFSQRRPGKDEQIFKMYKFRTMTNQVDANGNLLPDEKRITKFGTFLRSTSIDELPELINIIKGDMSIVGPRPLLIKYLPYYTERERKRHLVRPGLTGLSQINGRNFLDWTDRFEIDVKYVENINFIQDFKIVVKTFLILLKPKANTELNIIEDFDVFRRKENI